MKQDKIIKLSIALGTLYIMFKPNKLTAANVNNDNIKAFMEVIKYAEGTRSQHDPYRVTYGYKHTILSLRDHPAVTGEWTGERLPDSICRGAGLNPGCKSTAAGAYQFVKRTWIGLRDRLGLEDFTSISQDAAAFELLNQNNSVQDIVDGNFDSAIEKNNRTWASLPGAGYNQPERDLSTLREKFIQFGGKILFV